MAGNCKYYKQEQYVSFDSGQTWSGTSVYRKGALIESASTDCRYVPPTPSYENQYLTFRPNGDTEYWFEYGDSENYTSISYSINSGQTWTVVDHNQHTVTVHSGDTIMWRGYGGQAGNGMGTFHSSGNTWEVEGNVMSLLYFDNFSGQTSLYSHGEYIFKSLFDRCSGMTNAENLVLPATILVTGCYYVMFQLCTSLTTAPSLPATTLATNCYYGMFGGCTSLTTAPELPATTLADYCYRTMFYECSSLTTAPSLPATTLTSYCYRGMFQGCTSLTIAPELPATTLADFCYLLMFYNCSNLNSITCLATDISATNCTFEWVYNVASSGTFTTPSSTDWTTGVSGIPTGWTRVNI